MLERCPHFRGEPITVPLEVSWLERCPHFRGEPITVPLEVSWLERCPHFRGEPITVPLEVSWLERCPHFRGVPSIDSTVGGRCVCNVYNTCLVCPMDPLALDLLESSRL